MKHEFQPNAVHPLSCAVLIDGIVCGQFASDDIHMPNPSETIQSAPGRQIEASEPTTCDKCFGVEGVVPGRIVVRLCSLHALAEEMRDCLIDITGEELSGESKLAPTKRQELIRNALPK